MASRNDWTDMNNWGVPTMFSKGQVGNPVDLTGIDSALPDWRALTNPAQSVMAPLNQAVNPMAGLPNMEGIASDTGWGAAIKSALGTSEAPGWAGMALGAGQGLMKSYLGMQQYKLAKETLNENKRQYAQQYEAQKTTTNAQLEDRQRARVSANPLAYQSVGDYMNKNRIV